MMYYCGKCGERFERLPQGVVRCPQCAYKVVYKIRDPIAKQIKAR